MQKIDFSSPCHVHFIGIGGVSMSGLARILRQRGFTVTGSDRERSSFTDDLEACGIRVAYPQKAENIEIFSVPDLVVYTAAIHPDNEEYAAAEKRGIRMMTRAELLGQIMDQFGYSVAVSGTHGKTTTTAMLSQILMDGSCDPTLSIGAVYPAIGSNVRIGSSGYFVAEACEYTNSFLELRPLIGIILNVEADHLDFFKDIDDIRNSFRQFASQVLPGGTVIMSDSIPEADKITRDIKEAKLLTFGMSEAADIRGVLISREGMTSHFAVHCGGAEPFEVTLNVPGDHNIMNALAAIAAAKTLGVSSEVIAGSLASFKGASRRFEKLGEYNGATIVDDYAHHPTEVRATLTMARGLGFGRIICAFQSHTYSRTKALMDEFADALSLADEVVLADIYPARETDTLGISSGDLRDKIRNLGHSCICISSFSDIRDYLEKNIRKNDLLIFMGAGIIDRIGYQMLE